MVAHGGLVFANDPEYGLSGAARIPWILIRKPFKWWGLR